jgi:hypothetical protein
MIIDQDGAAKPPLLKMGRGPEYALINPIDFPDYGVIREAYHD